MGLQWKYSGVSDWIYAGRKQAADSKRLSLPQAVTAITVCFMKSLVTSMGTDRQGPVAKIIQVL